MTGSIYLDNLATTRLAPAVLTQMLPWLGERYGNPSSSTHKFGWEAAEAVDAARGRVRRLVGARGDSEILFTSGATESNNTVIAGVRGASPENRRHVVTSAIEHASVLAPCQAPIAAGLPATLVAPGRDGVVSVAAVAEAIRPETCLISVMAANNEIGTLQPIGEIAELARAGGILLHVDAAQAIGKVEVDVRRLGVDFLSLSAHKFHGPQGIGALYVRDGALPDGLPAFLLGGGQQEGRRAGTQPVASIVGIGAAAEIAEADWCEDAARMAQLADRLRETLERHAGDVAFNGGGLPGCLNFSVSGVLADALIAATPQLAFSAASACSAHHGGDSHVLRAIGLDRAQRQGSVRIGIGRENTLEEIDLAAELLSEAIERLRP
jgi:cysteine desulfurase